MTATRVDKRRIRDRQCTDCCTPITRYSTSGKCAPCARPRQVCERCGNFAYGPMCSRCRRHEDSALAKHATRPTDAQRAAWGMSKLRLTTIKSATPLDGECVHRWLITDAVPGDGQQEGLCRLCGATRIYSPWAVEDAPRAGRKVTA